MPQLYQFPFMHRAIALAKEAALLGEVPVGAVLVKDGKVLAEGYNLTETDCDPTAHAEIVTIRKACRLLESPRLAGCELYVTLEPCPMCAQAISNARIARLYFGATDPKGGGIVSGVRLFASENALFQPQIYAGILEAESAEILKEFFQSKRGL